MPHTQHQAIVVRSFLPNRHKVSLFDASAGRIEATVCSRSAARMQGACMQGALITYERQVWRDTTILQEVALQKLPQAWVCEDLLFLHHILEMIHYFSPEQSHARSVFDFLSFLYEEKPDPAQDLVLVKRLFVAKLFALLGVYPEGVERTRLRSLFYMLACGEKEQIQQMSDEQLHVALRTWIWGCIQTHPQAEKFMTLSFVNALE